jgi:hypothetical protein
LPSLSNNSTFVFGSVVTSTGSVVVALPVKSLVTNVIGSGTTDDTGHVTITPTRPIPVGNVSAKAYDNFNRISSCCFTS